MSLKMDSRKWKILGFNIRHTEGGSEAYVTFVTLFFLKASLIEDTFLVTFSDWTLNWSDQILLLLYRDIK